MPTVKLLVRGLCSSLFKFSLFMLAMTAALAMVFGTPQVLKQSIADSGAYDSFVDSALDEAQKEQGGGAEDIPLDRPEVKAAVQSAFTPNLIKNSTEQFIDGTYGWLEGKTPQPQFRIDLTETKTSLNNSLASYAEQRASSLPVCNLAQLRELQGREVEPYNVSCLPPGVSAAAIRQRVLSDLASSDDFLSEPVITEANLPKNEAGRTAFQEFEQGPEIFSIAKSAPYVFGIISILTAAGIVLLGEDRRRSLRIIGYGFISVGVVVLISTWLVSFAMNQASSPGGPIGNLSENNFQQALFSVVSAVTKALNNKLYIFCLVYILLGIGLFIIIKLTGQKQPEAAVETGLMADRHDSGHDQSNPDQLSRL